MTKTWFLYLIECVDGSIYTGITVDVAARYLAHCQGSGARYARAHPPVRLLGYESHPDRSTASQAEYRIKQLSPQAKRLYAETLIAPENPGQIPRVSSGMPPAGGGTPEHGGELRVEDEATGFELATDGNGIGDLARGGRA